MEEKKIKNKKWINRKITYKYPYRYLYIRLNKDLFNLLKLSKKKNYINITDLINIILISYYVNKNIKCPLENTILNKMKNVINQCQIEILEEI